MNKVKKNKNIRTHCELWIHKYQKVFLGVHYAYLQQSVIKSNMNSYINVVSYVQIAFIFGNTLF